MRVIPYDATLRDRWDEAVSQVRQASFLFYRDFMDYHRDRFVDRSLLVESAHGKVLALLPASEGREDVTIIESHGGLTYGGLLLLPTATTATVCEIGEACMAYYRHCGYRGCRYKPVPGFYHTYPSEEDLYWLFRQGARLEARAASSVIDLRAPYPFNTLRRRKVNKARKDVGLTLSDEVAALPAFWQVLTEVLRQRHDTRPVHTVEEITRLQALFPEQIRLCTVCAEDRGAGCRVLAGCVLFLTPRVVHVQYIASSDEGCEREALDLLFAALIARYAAQAEVRPWFDFGISTEAGGHCLNEGLIFQKEGFGARTLCYDTYYIDI